MAILIAVICKDEYQRKTIVTNLSGHKLYQYHGFYDHDAPWTAAYAHF